MVQPWSWRLNAHAIESGNRSIQVQYTVRRTPPFPATAIPLLDMNGSKFVIFIVQFSRFLEKSAVRSKNSEEVTSSQSARRYRSAAELALLS
jgi:hypothetical protein